MKQRVALYARYSDPKLQSFTSIEDQIRLCREYADSQGWSVVQTYHDAGISGASLMLRPDVQSLVQAAMSGAFDVILCEALDRLSRSLHEVAGLYAQLEFLGVKIITLAEGEITTMHIAMKGTMNQMYLTDLAKKVHRGLSGRVVKGKSGGGLAYGYDVVKQFDINGEPIKGDREINAEQAEIVKRIFHAYAFCNQSPKAICSELNQEGVPCPSGKQWSASTIYGNRKRGTGILNNELYIGQLVWNRQTFLKNPNTGRRVPRYNPEHEWLRQDVPHLRIIDQKSWDAVKAKQKTIATKSAGLHSANRPIYLLSGLLKCGVCGGGYSKISKDHYGCSSARNKGTCDNRKTVHRLRLEEHVLEGLQTRLMREDLMDEFCAEFTKQLNLLHRQQNSSQDKLRQQIAEAETERLNLVQALKDGIAASLVKDDLIRVTNHKATLEASLKDEDTSYKPLIHPSMGRIYRHTIKDLRAALAQENGKAEAAEHLRRVIDKIVLTPRADKNDLQIDLYGDLAGILNLATGEKDMMKPALLEELKLLPAANDNENLKEPIAVVAGAGFEPATFGL